MREEESNDNIREVVATTDDKIHGNVMQDTDFFFKIACVLRIQPVNHKHKSKAIKTKHIVNMLYASYVICPFCLVKQNFHIFLLFYFC